MLIALPTLETERLHLRPFTLADAPTVRELAGAREVAATTLLIPHPYPEGAAEAWIATHSENVAEGKQYTFALVRREDNALIGAMGLVRNSTHNKAELGYWIGVPYWNQGYATEAACAIVSFGFETLNLNRIFACHFLGNPASGRVMQKAGLQYEGTHRQDLFKWGEYIDHAVYGITRDQYNK